ncbi:MAG: hypothetical protein WBM54_06775, partial [Woeseia sp.]
VLRLMADDGQLQSSDEVTITVNPEPGSGFVEVRVATDEDDAEERASGRISRNSSDLELINDGGDQIVAMRFNGVAVPQGATITNAYLQFQTDETSSGTTSLFVQAEASDDSPPIGTNDGNISERNRTANFVQWDPPAWTQVGAAGAEQQTPNLAIVIQEIVVRGGWGPGNSVLIIVTGSGSRVAESYDGSSAGAPLLHIEYQE